MDIVERFCVKECGRWINKNKFKEVYLEFSDLKNSELVDNFLEKETESSLILAEFNKSDYGICISDEMMALELKCDAIIKFHSSPLIQETSLPVLIVMYEQILFDSNKLIELILSSSDGPKKDENIILLYDICFTPFISSFYDILKTHFPNVIISKWVIPEKTELMFYNNSKNLNFEDISFNETNEKTVVIKNDKLILPGTKDINNYNFMFICSENPDMLCNHIRFSDNEFYLIDHAKSLFKRSNFIKTIMERENKIRQICEAKSFGILISCCPHHQTLDRIKALLESNNKRYGVFYNYEFNEAELKPIAGADILVYAECPKTVLFDRHKAYLCQDIVTIWEIELAFNPFYKLTVNVNIGEESKVTKENDPQVRQTK